MNMDSDKIRSQDGPTRTGYPTFEAEKFFVRAGFSGVEYPDRKIYEVFKDGKINGPVFIDGRGKGDSIGYISNGRMCGWGMSLSGNMRFGVFENDRLKVDVSPLIREILDAIRETLYHFDTRQMDHVCIMPYIENPEIFVGVSDLYNRYGVRELGFHFLQNGEVYIGSTEIGEGRNISGVFFHFDSGFNTQIGRYNKGRFVENIDKLAFLTETNYGSLLGTPQFYSFRLDMNYGIDNFDLNKRMAYHIFATANHPDYTLVMANPYLIGYSDGEKTLYKPKPDRTEETRFFMFPNKTRILYQIERIINSSTPWIPMMDDFHVTFINCLIDKQSYPHLTVYKKETDSDLIINLWGRIKTYELDNKESKKF